MNSTDEEYGALAVRYGEMPDGDLLRLAATPEDLTELALQALTKEMARRGLKAAEGAPEESPQTAGQSLSPQELEAAWVEYGRNAPPEFTFWFQTVQEANEACALLGESGIESLIRSDLQPPLLVVSPEAVEQAAVVLGRLPLPPAADEEQEDFATPTCPNCGTADPILEGIEPVNRWACEACDHEWEDGIDPAG